MMIKLLKYLKGYLRIRVWGFSTERFINLCSNKNILLWDIVQDGESYYMCVSLKGFWQLKEITRKTGTRVVICERHGLPFFVPTLRTRIVFVVGLFLAVGFWIWSSFYIWDIRLSGNYRITEDVFSAFLRRQEVDVGMRKGELNIEELEKEIRRTFTEITWTSAKLTGTKLYISIKENDAPIISVVENTEEGMDLIADYAGEVVSMIVRSGVPKVTIGDLVEEGSLLVEGKVPVFNEDATVREYRYVEADADIVLKYNLQFRETLPFDYIRKAYTGRTKKRFFVRIGEREWKMPENKPYLYYDSVIKTEQLLVFEKLSIPVYWGAYLHREYQNVEHEYTLVQAEGLLNKKLQTFLTTLEEKGVQIIEKDVKIDTSGVSWVIGGQFLVNGPVGKLSPTEIVAFDGSEQPYSPMIDTVNENSGETNRE